MNHHYFQKRDVYATIIEIQHTSYPSMLLGRS